MITCLIVLFVCLFDVYLFFVCLFTCVEGTYAADDKDADLFSDTSSITGRSAITSTTGTSLMSKTSG